MSFPSILNNGTDRCEVERIMTDLDQDMNPTQHVRDFIINNFLFGDGSSLEDNTSFLNSGIIDSTGMLELITFLENTFKIKIGPEEMVPENLDTVNRVALFLQRKGTTAAL